MIRTAPSIPLSMAFNMPVHEPAAEHTRRVVDMQSGQQHRGLHQETLWDVLQALKSLPNQSGSVQAIADRSGFPKHKIYNFMRELEGQWKVKAERHGTSKIIWRAV